MSAFLPSVSIAQSADGTTITATDNSPYGANDQAYVLSSFSSRVLTVKDSLGNVLQTLTFAAGATTVSFTLTKDLYLEFDLNWTTPTPLSYTNVVYYLCVQYYINAQAAYAAMLVPGCTIDPNQMAMANQADQCYDAAVFKLTLSGTGVDCQTLIDAANALMAAVVALN